MILDSTAKIIAESEPSTFHAYDTKFRERMISNGREYVKYRQDRMNNDRVYVAGEVSVPASKFKVKGKRR